MDGREGGGGDQTGGGGAHRGRKASTSASENERKAEKETARKKGETVKQESVRQGGSLDSCNTIIRQPACGWCCFPTGV